MKTIEIKEKISKKGNRVICIYQNKNKSNQTEYYFPWLNPRNLFKTIVKIKTIADKNKLEPYLDMTIEEVFEIAVKNQNWDILPYSEVVSVELPTTFVMNTFYEDIEKIKFFFNEYPNGIFSVRDTMTKYTKNEFYNKLT